MRPWIPALAVLVVAGAYPLTVVEFDHSAPPRQTLQLSQREFYAGYTNDENTGVSLGWSWATSPEIDSVSPAELAALGLRCDHDDYQCGMAQGRRGWAVIGLDTVAWRGRIDTVRMAIDSTPRLGLTDSGRAIRDRELASRMAQAMWHNSRLKLFAVGTDPGRLAATWPDGYLVLPASLSANRTVWPGDSLHPRPTFYTVYARLAPGELYVPREWARAVQDSTGYWDRLYRVTVGVGGHWLPRILEVIPDAPPATAADSLHLFGIAP